MTKKFLFFVFVFLGSFALSGCAGMMAKSSVGDPIDQQEISVEDSTAIVGNDFQQTLFWMKDPDSGMAAQYSVMVITTKIDGDSFTREVRWVDLDGEYILPDQLEVVFFKLEVFNPTGESIALKQKFVFDEYKEEFYSEGGNVSNSIFTFPVPLNLSGERNQMNLTIVFDGGKKELETKPFVFLRK